MEQLNLPFRLGMDYEELEFDLEILPDRIQGYDSYIYLGEFNNFLSHFTDRTELLFKLDVLEGIIIYLPIIHPEAIVAKLESLLSKLQIVFEQEYKLYKFDLSNILTIWLVFTSDTTYILLSNSNLIHPLFTSLLW